MNRIIKLLKDRPIYVISDIHGGLDLFISLLKLVEKDSYLFILGDLFEKGKKSLETLRYVMDLSKRDNTYIILGNNDEALLHVLEPQYIDLFKNRLNNPTSILYDMISEGNFEGNILDIQKQMKFKYRNELHFIRNLPLSYETQEFIFCHAGIDDNDFTNRDALLRFDNFYHYGHNSDKIVICGHYPTAIYHYDRFDNSIIIDIDKKIICTDGGYGATNYGQLNMLKIVRSNNGCQFKTYYQDYFPEVKITKNQKAVGNKRGLCYPNYEIKVLKKGKYFTEAINVSNGEVVNVKNEFIIEKNNKHYTIDDTPNNLLEVKKGDIVKMINNKTAGYALVKKEGIFGWVDHRCIGEEK